MFVKSMMLAGFLGLGLLAPKAEASLSYEFQCQSVRQEQESSVLRVAISPDGADLMALAFEGEIEESYTRDEVAQFKFDPVRGELFLFVKKADPEKSGPKYFRLNVKKSSSNGDLSGKFEILEMKDLSFRVAHSSHTVCKPVQ